MFEISDLLTFSLGAFVLVVVPGPAVLYIVTRSIDQGRLAGLVSVLGINTAVFFHSAAVALGLSAILAQSALAFSAIKFAGAGYLVYLGMRKLLSKVEPLPSETDIHLQADEKLSAIYAQGFLVNLLNPKAAIFFLAFLPQFVDPARGSAILQIFILGAIFALIAFVSDGTYAIVAGTVRDWLRRSRAFAWGQRYVSGSVYVALGVTTAFVGGSQK